MQSLIIEELKTRDDNKSCFCVLRKKRVFSYCIYNYNCGQGSDVICNDPKLNLKAGHILLFKEMEQD